MPPTVFYAVKIGRNPGIYTKWEDALKQTMGFSCAFYKKFKDLECAQDFLNECSMDCNEERGIYKLPKKYVYAVHRGRKPGVYQSWDECSEQVLNFRNGCYRKFDNINDAMEFVKSGEIKRGAKRKISGLDSSLNMGNNFLIKKRKVEETTKHEHIPQNPVNFAEVFTCGAVHSIGPRKQAGIGVFWGPNHPLNTSKRITGKQTILRAKIYAVVHALNQAKQLRVNNVALHTNFCEKNLDAVLSYIKMYKARNWIINDKDEFIKNKDALVALDCAVEGMNLINAKIDNSKIHSIAEVIKLADMSCSLPFLKENISMFENFCNETILNSCDKIPTHCLSKLDFKTISVPSTSKGTSSTSVLHNNKIKKTPFYAVYKGHRKGHLKGHRFIKDISPGIYRTWEECRKQLINFPNAVFKHFYSEEEAQKFVSRGEVSKNVRENLIFPESKKLDDGFVSVFIDGSSFISDSVRAGIGVYWSPSSLLNLSLRLPDRQTNNRAEMWAAIHALRQAKQVNIQSVRIHTDSQFMIKVVTIYLEKCKIQNSWKIADDIPTIYEQDFKALDEAMAGMKIDWCYVAEPKSCPELLEAEILSVAGCTETAIETVNLE